MAQCHRDNCDSTAHFGVDVHLEFLVESKPRRFSFHSTIEVCHAHRDTVEAFVMSDDNKKSIAAGMKEAGFPEPRFDETRVLIDFLPLEVDQTRVLAPIAKCDRDGCENPGRWQVQQRLMANILRDGKISRAEVKMLTNLCVCNAHKKDTRAADFRTGENRRTMLKYLSANGAASPDFSTLKIEFIKLEAGQRVDPVEFVGADR